MCNHNDCNAFSDLAALTAPSPGFPYRNPDFQSAHLLTVMPDGSIWRVRSRLSVVVRQIVAADTPLPFPLIRLSLAAPVRFFGVPLRKCLHTPVQVLRYSQLSSSLNCRTDRCTQLYLYGALPVYWGLENEYCAEKKVFTFVKGIDAS